MIANVSTLTGGILSDKLEKDTYYAKPGIIIISSIIAAPIIIAGLLRQDSFEFSIACLALHFVFSQAFETNSLTMF